MMDLRVRGTTVVWAALVVLALGLVWPVLVVGQALLSGGGGAVRPEMVWLPAGPFNMGSEDGGIDEKPVHPVQLSAFAISRTEISQGQFLRVMDSNPTEHCTDAMRLGNGSPVIGDDFPVVCVDWFEAIAYANALSRLEGLTPAYEVDGEKVTWNRDADGYRLPTEAEWEYAARANTDKRWAGTSDEGTLCELANTRECGGELKPVRGLKPNAWTLYDMSGNVWEWVWDRYGDYPDSLVVDPAGPDTGSYRVGRGGSWLYSRIHARVANRIWWHPSYRYGLLGFRVARSPSAPSPPDPVPSP